MAVQLLQGGWRLAREEMSDYYEPWQPQLGDRVLVRLSGECQDRLREFDHAYENSAFSSWYRDMVRAVAYPESGHPAAVDGAVGTVDVISHDMEELDHDWWHGHWYGVWFDKPVIMTEVRGDEAAIVMSGVHLAAIELEPLGETGPYGRGHWPELQYKVEAPA